MTARSFVAAVQQHFEPAESRHLVAVDAAKDGAGTRNFAFDCVFKFNRGFICKANDHAQSSSRKLSGPWGLGPDWGGQPPPVGDFISVSGAEADVRVPRLRAG
jgi:hypothetical protein